MNHFMPFPKSCKESRVNMFFRKSPPNLYSDDKHFFLNSNNEKYTEIKTTSNQAQLKSQTKVIQ